MNIIKLDIKDGLGLIEVAVSNSVDANRLHNFVNNAYAALNRVNQLEKDRDRLDWLANPKNMFGSVTLPTRCVIAHIDSLRDAIDMAMEIEAGGDNEY